MTPNTTARQAGLTDEQIADAIPLTAMIVYGAVSGDPKTVRMNLGELREFAANILAAHSADARNGEGVAPSAWTWYEPADEFNGYQGRQRIAFDRPKQGPCVKNLQPLCLAAPAAPAPKQMTALEAMLRGNPLSPHYETGGIQPTSAPAPAAQADDAKLDAAFSDATNAAVALERRQSAAPAAPFAWTSEDEREPITDALKRARMDVYGKHYTVPLYRANPADAASEADKRDALAAAHEGDWHDMMSAYNRCPADLSHPDRMRWLAAEFRRLVSLRAIRQRERQQGAQSNG